MARQEKRTGVEINMRQAGRNQKGDEGVVGLLHALRNETVGYSTVPPLVVYLLACTSVAPTVHRVYLYFWPWVE